MKKLLTILLSLMLILCLFVGCADDGATSDEDDEKKEDKEDDNDHDAVKVLKKYFEAWSDLDSKKASKYTDDPDAFLEEHPTEEDAIAALVSDWGEDTEDFAKDFYKLSTKIASDIRNYEIKSTEEDDDKYIVEVEVTTPVDSAMDDLDDIIDSYYNLYYNEVDVSQYSSQEEFVADLFDVYGEDILEDMENLDIEAETETVKYVLVEDDGEWLISVEDTEF